MYEVRAMSGSTTTMLYCHAYPIQSGIPQTDMLIDRPLYRPTAVQETDTPPYVTPSAPALAQIEPDLEWIFPPITTAGATQYGELEAFLYYDLETFTYEQLENTGLDGIGERFEILGPFDVPTTHRLINDGVKQCWLIVDVVAVPVPGVTRFDLEIIAPWLQDPTDVLQVGYLTGDDNPIWTDPYQRIVRGRVDQDGDRYYLNTMGRTFLETDLLYLKCLKRAYDHCRPSGGVWGAQTGLVAESDESPAERDWVVSRAVVLAWRGCA